MDLPTTSQLSTIPRQRLQMLERTPFETLCNQANPQPHLLSFIHNLLFADNRPSQTLASCKWEKDLSITPSEKQWEQSLINIHKGLRNVITQENGYKIVSRWYRTPTLLHKINPEISATCWRCHAVEGTLLHIWWSCTSVQTFWAEVHRITSQVTSYDLEFSPAQFLLHLLPLPHRTYPKSLAMHMINAAKQSIPIHWNSTHTPTIREWLARIRSIRNGRINLYCPR